jgi:hypothetical protein
LAALSFQTPEILKGATSGLEDETWLFGVGADRRVRYNYTVAMQRSIPGKTAEAEFGSTIIPATLSGKPTSVVNAFSSLLVLKDIIMIILTCQFMIQGNYFLVCWDLFVQFLSVYQGNCEDFLWLFHLIAQT